MPLMIPSLALQNWKFPILTATNYAHRTFPAREPNKNSLQPLSKRAVHHTAASPPFPFPSNLTIPPHFKFFPNPLNNPRSLNHQIRHLTPHPAHFLPQNLVIFPSVGHFHLLRSPYTGFELSDQWVVLRVDYCFISGGMCLSADTAGVGEVGISSGQRSGGGKIVG